MSTGTGQTYCPDCGKWYNSDVGHRCPSPGARIGMQLTDRVDQLRAEVAWLTDELAAAKEERQAAQAMAVLMRKCLNRHYMMPEDEGEYLHDLIDQFDPSPQAQEGKDD